ncbi:DUF4825 domain-containing protein [Psychrobacillus sp.]|uniref:DUF4825 domain-containing protein n=1 Tax=Psychrobacillus sp. TaxID=1871623 RepID=UPI0028BF4AA9|nr:DUF4825 domain-containing protein [Psychrobacillus sp.]
MQKTIWLAVGAALVLLLGVFYVLRNNQVKSEEDKETQLSTATHRFEKVLAYENDYMGYASNTNNLFNNLPLADKKEGIELNSDESILIVNYKTVSDEEVEKAVIYNATAAFVLIKNLQEIDMRFSNHSYAVTRENVEHWFGGNFAELIEPSFFKEAVQDQLLKPNTNEWLTVYIN